MPTSVSFDLNLRAETVGPFVDYSDKSNELASNLPGYLYDDRILRWFSTVMEQEVVVLRTPTGHERPTTSRWLPTSKPHDLTGNYTW
jgi:hypothetical protein